MNESQVNLSSLPPIPAKNTIAVANFLLLKTIDFINKFYHDTENKLLRLEQRMDKLDTLTLLLEAKINSIPAEILQSAQQNNNSQQSVQTLNVPQSTSQSQPQQQDQPQQVESVQQQPEPQVDPEEERKKAEFEELREQYLKFIKMYKVGVNINNVKQSIMANGLDPDKLDMFIDPNFRPM